MPPYSGVADSKGRGLAEQAVQPFDGMLRVQGGPREEGRPDDALWASLQCRRVRCRFACRRRSRTGGVRRRHGAVTAADRRRHVIGRHGACDAKRTIWRGRADAQVVSSDSSCISSCTRSLTPGPTSHIFSAVCRGIANSRGGRQRLAGVCAEHHDIAAAHASPIERRCLAKEGRSRAAARALARN